MSGPSRYILVVGVPGSDRDWVETTLLRAGFVVAASSEAELRAGGAVAPPTLVVQDDAGGGEARLAQLTRLTAHPGLRGVPLLTLAYDADVESYTGAIRVAAAYLVKPVDPDELVDVVRRLDGWRLRADETEKRRSARRPLIMKVHVRLREQKRDVPGQLLDVAGGGCRVELPEAVEPGTLVRVVLHTRDESMHVALGAETRWCRPTPGGLHEAGLRFTGTTAMMAGRLLGFVSTEGT